MNIYMGFAAYKRLEVSLSGVPVTIILPFGICKRGCLAFGKTPLVSAGKHPARTSSCTMGGCKGIGILGPE